MSETPEIGHNSNAARSDLLAIIERIEAQETEIRERQEDRKEIYLEAKSRGYDIPALKAIVRMRREDAEKREQREAMIDLYRGTLGID